MTRPKTQRNTESLLAHWQAGNSHALEELLARNEERLLAFVAGFLRRRKSKIDARDIVQQVFLHVIERPAGFVEEKHDQAFYHYLRKIAAFKALKAIRKKTEKRIEELVQTPSGSLGVRDAGKSPSSAIAQKEWEGRLGDALRSIPETERTILIWRDFDELSFNEIAKRMGKKNGQSAIHAYWRAVDALGNAYKKLGAKK